MNVRSLHWPSDQPLTRPFPLRNGVLVALRSGDLYSPDSWSQPKHYTRSTKPTWRPYLAVRWGKFGFYIGWKVFGVDGEQLKTFPGLNSEDVYQGSVAMQGFTVRFSANVKDEGAT